jgi:Leucine-rich repeat (LRR) protein
MHGAPSGGRRCAAVARSNLIRVLHAILTCTFGALLAQSVETAAVGGRQSKIGPAGGDTGQGAPLLRPLTCPDRCSCTVPTAPSTVTASDRRSSVVAVSCSDLDLPTIQSAGFPAGLLSVSAFDFSGNRVESLSESSSLPATVTVDRLTSANFSRNRIDSIKTSTFGRWSALESLDLSANRLSTVDHGTFAGGAQTSLRMLDLSGNRLTDIDGGFSGMINLTRLDLRNNFITALTEFTFRDLKNLHNLLLTNNRIEQIDPQTFRPLANLLYLVLKGNPLGGVIDRFYFHSPSTLSYIDLSECGLRDVPRGLPGSLRYVQLRRNNLTALDASTFSECPSVNIVVLDENRIETIQDGTFGEMTLLDQLWLNGNRLTNLPRPLPVRLRRLLADNNRIRSVDADTFPARSQLSVVSLVGNQLALLLPEALRRLGVLRSLDLSNNRLTAVGARTFAGNGQLHSLTLSMNPLRLLEPGAFDGLRSLEILAIGYVSTDSLQIDDPEAVFAPMMRLRRLDLDNSPAIAAAIFEPPPKAEAVSGSGGENRVLAEWLASVDELGLANCQLTSLPDRMFERRLPRLRIVRLGGSQRWHCDASLRWMRDWLVDPNVTVRVDGRPDIRCTTPATLRDRPLVSLADDEFVLGASASVTSQPTTSKALDREEPDVGVSSTPSSSTLTTKTPEVEAVRSTTSDKATYQVDENVDYDYELEPEIIIPPLQEPVSPTAGTNSDSDVINATSTTTTTEVIFKTGAEIGSSSISSGEDADIGGEIFISSRTVTSSIDDKFVNAEQKTSSLGIGNTETHSPPRSFPVVAYGSDVSSSGLGSGAIGASRDGEDEEGESQLASFKMRVIIAAATVGATLIVASFIVAGIVYVCRRGRRRDRKSAPGVGSSTAAAGPARTFIKYKHKNGVLYFSTPADPPTSASGPDCLVAGETSVIGQKSPSPTVANVEILPPPSAGSAYKTRVYRWEDF